MSQNIAKEVVALHELTLKELQARYAEAFGEATRSNHKQWLLKRIAWRLQVLAEGDLAERALERARMRAAELANDADLRLCPPLSAALEPTVPLATCETAPTPVSPKRLAPPSAGRLPLPGSEITRLYKGRSVAVKVLPQGFQWAGRVFGSLSAVAKAITGQHCSGYVFFKLKKEPTDANHK